ncbi:MAG: hypothetical protein Q7R39_13330 [Dehalococcoidia bacterium]|nr:hypothetical protein [Dehalococcoidia bacterium]
MARPEAGAMVSTLHFTIAGGSLHLDADGRRASARLPDLPGDPFKEVRWSRWKIAM